MASTTVGHDDSHNELFAFAVRSVGRGLGHDGSLGFIVQKPPLPTSFARRAVLTHKLKKSWVIFLLYDN